MFHFFALLGSVFWNFLRTAHFLPASQVPVLALLSGANWGILNPTQSPIGPPEISPHWLSIPQAATCCLALW